MADHGTVEYATATGNDYPAHEGTYERFVHFTFVGHPLCDHDPVRPGDRRRDGPLVPGGGRSSSSACWARCSGLLSGSKTSSYVAFAICFLIFAFAGLSPH